MKKLFFILFLFLFSTGCKEVEKVEISIPTAQCGMCENNIHNALMDVDGVEKVKVDLENSVVKIAVEKEELNLSKLENVISNAGYVANDKLANNEVYQTLREFCKLPEDS